MKKYTCLPLSLLLAACAAPGPRPAQEPVGLEVASGLVVEPSLAVSSDEAGSALVAYTRAGITGPASVVAKKFAPSGAAAWAPDGVALSTSAVEPGHLVVERGAGGWIALWREREGEGWSWRAQRLSDSGRAEWPVPVKAGSFSGGRFDMDYTATADGSLMLAWGDLDASSRTVFLSLSKVTPAGEVAWTRRIGKGSVDAWYQLPKLDWDEAGGAFLSYRQVDQGDRGLVLQHFSSSGEPLWPKGLGIYDGGGYKSPALMLGDAHGGVIMAWEDGRSGTIDVYSQRIGPSGQLLWSKEGVPIAWGSGNQWSPAMAPDGHGGVYIAWIDNQGSRAGIKTQHLDGDGRPAYPAGGQSAAASAETQAVPMIAVDGENGAFVGWYESRFSDYGIYGQRLGTRSGALWDREGLPIAVSGSQKTGLRLAYDGRGGALVAWKSRGSGKWEVRAQRVRTSGRTGWGLGPEATKTLE